MKIPNLLHVLALLICVFPTAWSQDLGLVARDQALRAIGTDLRLMCVATHPDDEDGATLALYRKAHGLDTFAVIATRGEGGQNEIGSELYEELAVIRTREMQAAAQITGAELHFLNLPDFGYSKTIEETYAIWGEREVLRRLVAKIREIRPDIIITHHGKQRDHGHHQAIGRSLTEAFDAAADPAQFPEQIAAGLAPWQAARLYIRSFTKTPAAVPVPIGTFDSVRGAPYTEIAAQALEEHESQGMGFFIDRFIRGQQYAWYELEKESALGVPGAGHVPAPPGVLLEGLYDRVSEEARAVSTNATIRKDALPALSRHANDAEFFQCMATLLETQLEAWVDDAEVVPGQQVVVHARLTDFGDKDLERVQLRLELGPGLERTPAEPLAAEVTDQRATGELVVHVAEDISPTLPLAAHVFEPGFLEPQIEVIAEAFTTGGGYLRVTRPIRVEVAAPVSLTFADSPYLVRRNHDESVLVTLQLENHQPDPARADVILSLAPGLSLDEPRRTFALGYAGAEAVWAAPVRIGKEPPLAARDYIITAVVDRAVEGNIPLNPPSEGDFVAHGVVRVVDLAVPANARVGVVQSYDDTYVVTLERMGISHGTLADSDFNLVTLDGFTAIIVDIRAYLVRPDLVANNQALLDYVHRGGTVIVSYQKTFEWKPEYAPYPIEVSRNRVTDEEAPVALLEPAHRLFHTPNEIVPEDWAGWRQERGLYFPDAWDLRYTPLIAVDDPGENIPPGSLLIARYGEGTYIYTALALYRQLRELHPGALRLFANMLAVDHQAS